MNIMLHVDYQQKRVIIGILIFNQHTQKNQQV